MTRTSSSGSRSATKTIRTRPPRKFCSTCFQNSSASPTAETASISSVQGRSLRAAQLGLEVSS